MKYAFVEDIFNITRSFSLSVAATGLNVFKPLALEFLQKFVVCIYHTFDDNCQIENDFTKCLKESYC